MFEHVLPLDSICNMCSLFQNCRTTQRQSHNLPSCKFQNVSPKLETKKSQKRVPKEPHPRIISTFWIIILLDIFRMYTGKFLSPAIFPLSIKLKLDECTTRKCALTVSRAALCLVCCARRTACFQR